MLKKKSIWVQISLVVVFMIIAFIAVTFAFTKTPKQFKKNGFVVVSNEQAESSKYAFDAGTEYKKTYGEQYTFEDMQKQRVEVDEDTFVHYEDGSVEALDNGVLVNLNEVNNSNAIHHYALQEGMGLMSSGSGYKIENNIGTIELKEAIWKISDTKYGVLSSNIEVVFDKDDIRKAGDFVEFNYIDEGVVQIVTDDNVWQTVSTTALIRTANGNEIHLSNQLIQNEKGKLPLSKMVIDADDNVELSPLETKEQKVPEFDIDAENGKDGTAGEIGSEGTAGEAGIEGTQGQNGENGLFGSKGEQGVTGSEGNNGNNGNKGGSGKPGSNGTNATNNSSAKTAIPEFTLIEWKVNATSANGKIKVDDPNNMIQDRIANIAIYDAQNGEKFIVKNDSLSGNSSEEFEFPADDFTFDTNGHLFNDKNEAVTLQPDHEYRLVVTANYEMNGENFTREFISRVFYTDSMGVFMEKLELSTTSIKGKLTKNDYSSAIAVTLHLLTEQELAEFAINGKSGIQQEITIEGKEEVEFGFDVDDFKDQMKSDTIYYIRMVIKSTSGQTSLSPQILKVATLKEKPVFTGQPFASPNRKLGAFELYGGTVNDPDGAIISHRYEVYQTDGSGNDTLVKSLDVKPSPITNMTMLNVDNKIIKKGEEYYFKVVTVYNDNEKMVELISQPSANFVMYGSSFPVVYYRAEDETPNPDRFEGNLIIDMSNDGDVLVNDDRPITLDIVAEGVFEKKLTIGSTTPNITKDQTQIIIPLKEMQLKDNTTYRINVHAYIKETDGSYVEANLGYVIVKTRPLATIQATWDTKNGVSGANVIQAALQLQAFEDKYKEDLNLMSEIHIELYNGSSSGVLLKTAKFTDQSKDGEKNTLVRDFVDNKKIITEKDFTDLNPDTLTGERYALKISTIYDQTYTGTPNEGNIVDDPNTFSIAGNAEAIVTKHKVPPSLPSIEDADEQIAVKPITNEQANSYGVTYNSNLDDDTIIGFKLEPRYANYASLARNITFHVYEANIYQEQILGKGLDPNKNQDALELQVYQLDMNVKASSITMPTPAIIFGKGTDNETIQTYYTGNYDLDQSMIETFKDGMQRGYKYIVTYTVGYNPQGDGEAILTYPYDHPDYATVSGSNGQYFLNSGIECAPKTEPKFYTIPFQQNGNSWTVNYAYHDVDQTIKKDQTSLTLDGEPVGTINVEANKWGQLTIDNRVEDYTSLSPQVERLLYNTSYTDLKESDKKTAMFTFPMNDKKTNTKIADIIRTSQLKLNVKEELNRVDVELDFGGTEDASLKKQAFQRISGIELRFYDTEENKSPIKTLRLPIGGETSNGVSTYFSTAILSELDKSKVPHVKATILYDTGNQGWNYANNKNDKVALQYINKDGLGSYISLDSQTELVKNYAMGSTFTFDEMFETDVNEMGMDMNMIEKTARMTSFYDTNSKKEYNLQFTQNGVSLYNPNVPDNVSLLVPKQIGYQDLGQSIQMEGFPINKITPSVNIGHNTASLDEIYLNNVKINGMNQIQENNEGKYTITVRVKGNEGSKDYSFEFTETGEMNRITLDHLKLGTQYTISFHAIGLDGKEMNLLDAKALEAKPLTLSITTLGAIQFNRVGVGYNVHSYRLHELILSYSVANSNGFKVEYTLYNADKAGVYQNIKATHQELIESGIITERTSYGEVNEQFNFDIRNEYKLEPGKYYVIKMKAINTVEGTGNQSLGEASVHFQAPVNTTPIPYIEMSPLFEDGHSSIQTSFSLPDLQHVIMANISDESSESVDENGKYYFRIFEQEGNQWKDITKDDDKLAMDVGANSLKTIKYMGLKNDTVYRVVLYAAVDTNRDMKHDINGREETLEELEESLNPDEFEKLLNEEYVLWEEECMTPGENGIAFGTMRIENPNGNNQYVSVAFKNASNLNMIESVEYNMILPESTYTGTLTNSEENPLFYLKDSNIQGYYLMDIPDKLEKHGKYKVILRFFVRNTNGELEEIKSYNDTYLY